MESKASKSTKKAKRFCKIITYLRQKDPALCLLIDDLCLSGMLLPRRTNGVTFLFPSPEIRKKIMDENDKDNPEVSIDIIRALTLNGVFHNAKEFSDTVTNKLFNKMKVKSADGNKVVFDGGLTIVKADDFDVIRGRGENSAVWVVESGNVDISSSSNVEVGAGEDDYSDDEDLVVGGNSNVCQKDMSVRALLSSSIENDFIVCWRLNKCKTRNPFLDFMVCLMQHLESKSPELADFVGSLLSPNPMCSFFIVVEPYKTKGQYIVNSDVFNEMLSVRYVIAQPVTKYKEFLEKYACKDSLKVLSEIDAMRIKLTKSTGGPNLGSSVKKEYESIVSRGKVGDVEVSFMRGRDASRVVWQDCLRFMVQSCQEKMEDIFEFVRDTHPGNDYDRECTILDSSCLKNDAQMLQVLEKFVNSTDFVYVNIGPNLATSSSLQIKRKKLDGELSELSDKHIVNMYQYELETLEKTADV